MFKKEKHESHTLTVTPNGATLELGSTIRTSDGKEYLIKDCTFTTIKVYPNTWWGRLQNWVRRKTLWLWKTGS